MLQVVMPLRELMRNFFDKLKSVSSGYASISYEMRELRVADVARLDILVADELVPAFTRIVAKHRAYEEAVCRGREALQNFAAANVHHQNPGASARAHPRFAQLSRP